MPSWLREALTIAMGVFMGWVLVALCLWVMLVVTHA